MDLGKPKQIIRITTFTLLAFGVLFVGQVLISTITLTAMHSLGASTDSGSWTYQLVAIAGKLVAVVWLIWVIRRSRFSFSTALKLRSAPLWAYPFTLIMAILTGPWFKLTNRWFGIEIIEESPQLSPVWLLGLVVIALLTPIVEEAIYRGYLYTAFEEGSSTIAVVLTTLLFAFGHFDPRSIWAFLAHVPLGLAWGLSLFRFRSLYPVIAVHILWNLLSVLNRSPVHWVEPNTVVLVITALLYLLCAGAMLRQSSSSLLV